VTFSASGVSSVICTVTQSGANLTLSVLPPGITVASTSGATGNFNVTSNTSWSVTDDATWLNLSSASGNGSGTLTVTTASANPSTDTRSANVTFSASGVSSVICTVTQSGIIITIPDLSTTPVSEITSTTAKSGGTITNDRGSSVTARGVCWSINENPTVGLSTKTSDGTGIGSFTSYITGLTPGITYYIRAYATNSAGTAYGDQVSFKCDLNTSINDIKNSEINVFPNPISGILTIEYLNDDFKSINILNSLGVILSKEKVVVPNQHLDFSRYEYGLYILEFVKAGGEVKRVKVLNH